MDSPTATNTPNSTPTTRTATVVASASTASLLPERRDPPELRHIDEPERGVHHDGAERGGREGPEQRSASSSTSTVAATVTSDASWLRLPTASPIAVRLPLLLTGKPCISPDARLAAPSPASSWRASTR